MLYFWNPDDLLSPNMMIDTSPWSSCSRWSPWLPCSSYKISSTGPSVSPFRDFWYFGWKISGLMEILLISSEVISWYSSQQYFGFPKVAMCFDGTLIRVWESDQNPILQMQPSPRWTLLLSSWIIEQTKIHDYFFHNIIYKWNPDMSKYDSLSFSMKLPYLSFSLGFNQFGKFGSI